MKVWEEVIFREGKEGGIGKVGGVGGEVFVFKKSEEAEFVELEELNILVKNVFGFEL